MSIARRPSVLALLGAVGAAALLGAVVAPLAAGSLERSREERTQRDARNVAHAFTRYHADTGRWPCNWAGRQNLHEELADYACLYSNTERLRGWNGPYLEIGVPLEGRTVTARRSDAGGFEGVADAWGNPFHVVFRKPNASRSDEAGGVILLLSSGPDRRLRTPVRDAVSGKSALDDIVLVVARPVD